MMTCDVCGFDVPPFTGQHTADDVLCADCLAKGRTWSPVERPPVKWDAEQSAYLRKRLAEAKDAHAEGRDAAAVGEARSGMGEL